MTPASRRRFLEGAAAALLPLPALAQGAAPKVVVVGGGFGGATMARFLKRASRKIDVTLVTDAATFTACPFSNHVIIGLREMTAQQFGYDKVVAEGVTLAASSARGVDATKRTVTLANGSTLSYDRLVMAPGIEIDWKGLKGYDEAAAEAMPHAWKA